MTNPSPYGEYPGYQQQPQYPSAPYQPYPAQEQQPYPAQEQPPYSGSYAPPPPPVAPYQAAPYQPQYAPGPGYPPSMGTSGLAIASLVCSLLGIGIVGVILGHLALNEINKSNGYTQGRGLAIAGLIIGYLQIAAGVIVVLFILLGVIFSANSLPTQ